MRRCRQERRNHVSFRIYNAWLRIDNPPAVVEGPGIAPEVTRTAPLYRVNSKDQTITMKERHQRITQEDIGAVPGSTASQGTILGPDEDGNPIFQIIRNVGDSHATRSRWE